MTGFLHVHFPCWLASHTCTIYIFSSISTDCVHMFMDVFVCWCLLYELMQHVCCCNMCVDMPEYVSWVYAYVCICVCVSGYKVTLTDRLYRYNRQYRQEFENSQGPHCSGDSWRLCGLLPTAAIQGVPLPLYLSFSYYNFMCFLQPCPWKSKIRMSRQVSGKEIPGPLGSWRIPRWLWWHTPAP